MTRGNKHLRFDAVMHRCAVGVAFGLWCGMVVAATKTAAPEYEPVDHRAELQAIESALVKQPQDPELNFMKALTLHELGQTDEAIAILQQLTEDHPELPEPYNNMAVLYYTKGDYDKARLTLERAIRTNPSYATAHENLGDVYAHLASKAYDRALQFDSGNKGTQTKLKLIRQLITNSGSGGGSALADAVPVSAPPVTLPTAAAPAKVEPVAVQTQARRDTPQPPVAPVPEPAPAPAPEPAPQSAPAAVASAPPVAKPAAVVEQATVVEPPVVAEPPAVEQADAVQPEPATADVAALEASVSAWASAWAGKDLPAYFAHYADDFVPAKGQKRAAWEAERQQRINKPGAITVEISQFKVIAVSGDEATVRFQQRYESKGFKSNAPKVLKLVRRDGSWLIRQELAGG